MSEDSRVTRIILADDHPVVMLGIQTLLRERGESLRVDGEATNGVELLALLASQECDLLITDFSMPFEMDREDGLQLLGRLRRTYPDLPIIVLTMIHNRAVIRGMLDVGVNGVVGKVAMVKELLLAVAAVMSGRTYLCESMREYAVEKAVPGRRPLLDADGVGNDVALLSRREVEVVRLYAEGLSVTQIALRVHRSVKTISQQKNDAMRKLGLTSNSQLYEYARAVRIL